MVQGITDAERKEIQRLLSQGTSTSSRFAPSDTKRLNVAPLPQPSRFSGALKTAGKAGKLLLSGKAATAALIPGVEEEDIERLPGPVKFAIDNLLSPVGLAALALSPVTGGGSIAARVGLGAALASKPLAVRAGVDLAGRIAADLAVAGVATQAAKGVSKALPDDADPKLRTALTLGAGLLGGVGSAAALSKAVNPAIKGTVAASAVERGDFSLPVLPSLISMADDTPLMPRKLSNPVTRMLMQGINPSKNATTNVGKLAIAKTQQSWSIDHLAKTYVAGHFPDNFSELYLRNGEALVEGKRVPWREVLDESFDSLTPAQQGVVGRWQKAIDSTIETYNETVPVTKHLSLNEVWVPRYNKAGDLLTDTDIKFKQLNDTARGMRLTKKQLEDPGTVLHVYAKTAMENRLRQEFDTAMEPLLRSSDDVLATTPEGKGFKGAWDTDSQLLKNAKSDYEQQVRLAKYGAAARKGEASFIRKTKADVVQDVKANRETIEEMVYRLQRYGDDLGDYARPGAKAVGRQAEVGAQGAFPGMAKPLFTPVEAMVPVVPHSMRQLEKSAVTLSAQLKATEKGLRAKRSALAKVERATYKTDIEYQQAVREGLAERNALDLELDKLQKEITGLDARVVEIRGTEEFIKNQKAIGTDSVAVAGYKLKNAVHNERISRQEWQKYKQRTTVTEASGTPWGAGDDLNAVSKYKGKYLIDNTGEIDELHKWTQNLTRGGAPLPVFNEVQQVADAARFFSASLDASGPFINLLPVLFHNPKAWEKALVGNWRALIYDPDLQLRYLSKNYDDIVEMVAHGVAPADIEQFISAARGGLGQKVLSGFGNPTAEKVLTPARALFTRAQTGYETGLLIGRREMWSALKSDPTFAKIDGTPDLRRIADFVREATGAWDSAYFGVAPTQRALESIVFFSPRMFRSILALGADAMRPWTPEGSAAAHTVLRMLAAGTGLFMTANAAIGIMAGESEEQVTKRMMETADPTNGRQFMSIKIGDEWYGIGGQIRAMTQALSRAVSNDDSGRDGNPLYDFLTGRAGPATRGGLQLTELMTGDDWSKFERIETKMDWITAQAEGFLPFYVQNGLHEGSLLDPSIAADIAGLSSKQRTSSDILDSEAYRRYGMGWKDLTGPEQDEMRAARPELEGKADDLLSNEDRAYQAATKNIDTRTSETLSAINSANMTQEDKRKRIEQTLRDRWLANKTTSENFAVASNIGPADSPKRLVLEAYFKTFNDSGIGPEGTTQTDWDKWEELQADLEQRIEGGAFGDSTRARQYLDERRKFKLPPELAWYEQANEVLKSTKYWEQKDVAFGELESLITSRYPEVNSARELESILDEAVARGDIFEAKSVQLLISLLNKRTGQKHKMMKFTNPALKEALVALGR